MLVENATAVELDGNRYPVRRPPKRGLRQVDFVFDAMKFADWSRTRTRDRNGRSWRGRGKKVMQFLSGGRYVAVVVDGKGKLYGR